MKPSPKLAIIGGSGLSEIPGLEDAQEHNLTTPFGNPVVPEVNGMI